MNDDHLLERNAILTNVDKDKPLENEFYSYFNGKIPVESGIAMLTDDPGDTGNTFHFLGWENEPVVTTGYASICMVGAAPGQNVDEVWSREWWE